MSKPTKLPRKKPEKAVQLIGEPPQALGPPSDQQRKAAAENIQEEATRPSRVDSEHFGTALCEFVPKQTWVMDDSYVHPEWYLKREDARKNRMRPWQTAGLTQRWRESGQFAELEKKTSEDLGFDELDDEKLDDPHLFDFDAIEAERAAKKKQKAVKKVNKNAYALYHTPIERLVTPKEEIDPRFHYERPVRQTNKAPAGESIPPIPVTLKAILVDEEPVAFAACSFTGRTQRTSKGVFDQFQKCLTNCQTLLPNGPFRILPPKGVNANSIYQKKASVKKGKGGKKRNKKAKAGKDKASKPVSPPSVEGRSSPNKTSVDQYVSFGDPSEPLVFANDLLEIASKPSTDQEKALKCLQLQEATNLREHQTVRLWRKCSTEEMWKRKRQRKVLQRFLQAHMTDSACSLKQQRENNGDESPDETSVSASRPRRAIGADDEYRTAEDSSTSTDDEDTTHCYDHKFLDDLESEAKRSPTNAAFESTGPPPTAFMSFSRPELHKRAKFQHVPRDDYHDLASTNLHHTHHYESEEDSTGFCQCESEWEDEDDPEGEDAVGKPHLRTALSLRLRPEKKGSLAVNSLFDSSIRLPPKTLKKLTDRLEGMGTFDIRKSAYTKPEKPMVSFVAHGQKLRSAKMAVKDVNGPNKSEDSLPEEVVIRSGPRRRRSFPNVPEDAPRSFPSREFLDSLCDGFSKGCEEDYRDQSGTESSESSDSNPRHGLEKWFYDTIVLKKIVKAPESLTSVLTASNQNP